MHVGNGMEWNGMYGINVDTVNVYCTYSVMVKSMHY